MTTPLPNVHSEYLANPPPPLPSLCCLLLWRCDENPEFPPPFHRHQHRWEGPFLAFLWIFSEVTTGLPPSFSLPYQQSLSFLQKKCQTPSLPPPPFFPFLFFPYDRKPALLISLSSPPITLLAMSHRFSPSPSPLFSPWKNYVPLRRLIRNKKIPPPSPLLCGDGESGAVCSFLSEPLLFSFCR